MGIPTIERLPMEEGKIWIEDDMKEILKIIKEGKYYIGTENREED